MSGLQLEANLQMSERAAWNVNVNLFDTLSTLVKARISERDERAVQISAVRFYLCIIGSPPVSPANPP